MDFKILQNGRIITEGTILNWLSRRGHPLKKEIYCRSGN